MSEFVTHDRPIHKARGLYMIEHIATGRRYIGITNNLWNRMLAHRRAKDNTRLHRAIRKYGPAAFSFRPLMTFFGSSSSSIISLKAMEADFITSFCAIDRGFNIQAADGAIGPYGPAFSECMRRLHQDKEWSARRIASLRNPSDAVRKNRSAAAKEVMSRPGIKERLRSFGKQRAADPVYRAKLAEQARNYHASLTEEQRAARIQKISQSQKGKPKKRKVVTDGKAEAGN